MNDNKDEKKSSHLVLAAIDDSSAAPLIVDFLTSHKWTEGTRFRLIHVIAPIMMDHPMASYPLFLESVEKDVRDYAEKLLLKVKSDMQQKLAQFEIETDVVGGMPAEVIVDEAKRLSADMIVVGSHGRTGFTKFFLGSVSGAVVSHAPCNVMIVRVPRKTVDEKTEKNAVASGTRKN